MSIVLAYPTLAAPASTVTLPDVERLPASRPVRMLQTRLETDAGNPIIIDHGDRTRTFDMTLHPLSAQDAANLQGFYENTVNGQATPFELRDSLGREYPVRFGMDVLEIQQQSPSGYKVNLVFREV